MSDTSYEQKKLVYYDAQGRQHEHTVPKTVYERMLRIFDGTPKAVERSTGGLGLALPHGIKLKPADGTATDPKILVSVNCTDFNPDASNAEQACHIRPKLIPIDLINPGFELSFCDDQRFVADFGEGIIPVYILQFLRSAANKAMAVFLDYRHAEAILNGKLRKETSVQLNWIPEDCLRWARKLPTGADELKLACRNHEKSLLGEKPAIPEVLRLGERVKASDGLLTLDSLKDHVHDLLHVTDLGSTQSRTLQMSEEGLIPFGMFEPG
jgi:hypothetical protein